MNDRDLEQLARRLGEREARRIDPDRTAAAVVARLRAERIAPRPTWSRPWVLRVAAAAALVAVVGLFALRDRLGGGPASVESLATQVQGLETLEPVELAEVLDSLTFAAPVTTIGPVALDELTVAQLRELLERMEG